MPRIASAVLSFIALSLVAGCVQPSQRIASTLRDYGMEAGLADCMGTTLEQRLSIGQLLELQRIAKAAQASSGQSPVDKLFAGAQRLEDPKIPLEVGRAGLICVTR